MFRIGAYSKVGAYSRGRLIEALRYVKENVHQTFFLISNYREMTQTSDMVRYMNIELYEMHMGTVQIKHLKM